MDNFSVLIGGKAGDGIDSASILIARIFGRLGYKLFIHRDYPSVIRGSHTFSIIRLSKDKIGCHQDKVDMLLALNQETIDLHKSRLKNGSFIIYNSDAAKSEGSGLPLEQIIRDEKVAPVMRNTCLTGALCKAMGIQWNIIEDVFKKHLTRELESNLKVAKKGFDSVSQLVNADKTGDEILPVLTGNEAIGLGLLRGGLTSYAAYPMTPSTGILHMLAQIATGEPSLKVLQPESEPGAILMALGMAYAGERTAVGTSGGGFCLMTEGLSFAGMAEIPVVIVLGQRGGPSTGLPTHTGQSDLRFALSAGHGGILRLVVAPGDVEEAYFWSAAAMNLSWKYQIPSIILSDKTLAEGTCSFDIGNTGNIPECLSVLWDGKPEYKRYADTETGVSPMAFPPVKDAVVKIDSYEHDEYGITTEDAGTTGKMQAKRCKKEKFLLEEIQGYQPVKMSGNENSETVILCWGSNKAVCEEAAKAFGVRVVRPVVLSPFPEKQFKDSLKGAKKIICVENNYHGQLAAVVSAYGVNVDEKILKYDGRPFGLEELQSRLKESIK